MGKTKIFPLVFVFLLFLAPAVFSAPAPHGIALNSRTKQCASYWAGDEYTRFVLPDGWEGYWPGYNRTGGTVVRVINTKEGSCDFSDGDPEKCCTYLGYAYVELELEGESTWIEEENFLQDYLPYLAVPFFLGAGVFCFLRIRKKNKSKTPF